MQRSPIWTALAALMLAASVTAASAQTDGQDHEQHHPEAPASEAAPAPQAGAGESSAMSMSPEMMQMMEKMMGQQGRMGPGMMSGAGPRMGMMGHGGIMRAMFAVMDADGDGALSQVEFQEAHGRIFNHMDADGDDHVTLEEMQGFLGGAATPPRQRPARAGSRMEHTVSESARAYMDAMQTMMDGMASMEMTGDPARDFALMMIPHHQSAIDMAEAFLRHGNDPELTNLAKEIVSAQQGEIEFLRNWLGETR